MVRYPMPIPTPELRSLLLNVDSARRLRSHLPSYACADSNMLPNITLFRDKTGYTTCSSISSASLPPVRSSRSSRPPPADSVACSTSVLAPEDGASPRAPQRPLTHPSLTRYIYSRVLDMAQAFPHAQIHGLDIGRFPPVTSFARANRATLSADHDAPPAQQCHL